MAEYVYLVTWFFIMKKGQVNLFLIIVLALLHLFKGFIVLNKMKFDKEIDTQDSGEMSVSREFNRVFTYVKNTFKMVIQDTADIR